VILVRQKGRQVEVATFRADGVYSDGRHPESVRFTTPQEDAQRRDFTCNGLFFDPVAGELHDFVDGRRDIEGKILRAIGEPGDRFAEDHLRMLRAVRFAARLGFSIEPGTRAAMEALQSRIATISRERIGEEVRMMLENSSRALAMELLAGFDRMFAEVFGFPVPPARLETNELEWPILSGLPQNATRAVALMGLLLDCQILALAGAIATLRSRLMLSNDETAELTWLAEQWGALEEWETLTKARFKRLMADPRWPHADALYRAAPENAEQILAYSERTASLAEEGVAPAPLITGHELIQLGVSPGPVFRRWLDELYDRQLEGELQTREQALAAARVLIAR
jgi:poly(A) polymerase